MGKSQANSIFNTVDKPNEIYMWPNFGYLEKGIRPVFNGKVT